MAVNVVHCSGRGNIVDLRQNNTISSDKMVFGKTAHASNGEKIVGGLDIANLTWDDLSSQNYNKPNADIPETQPRPINKVLLNNQVVFDLTEDTASSNTVLSGVIFHSSDGSLKAGTLKLSELTWNGYNTIV